MHFHIILTEICNSKCNYCYEKSLKEFDNGLQKKWNFDIHAPINCEINIDKLKNFLRLNDTLIFYGGEPLLQIKKIKEIMDKISGIKFCIQTNGKLLDKLPEKYIKKFSKILVSIDGDKKRTDYNKGIGTYEKVLKNIKKIRKNFKGEIVARMTIAQEFPDISEQVKNLNNLKIFDSIHWQIDAGFYKFDFNLEMFFKFVTEYNKDISKLIDYWVKLMEKEKKVLKFYPFTAIINSFLKNEVSKLRCGAGYANYTITTKGDLVACPIMGCIKNFYCGDLDSKISKLKQIFVGKPCISCDYLKICGGRCLYSNKAKLWPKKGEELICDTVKNLIDELKKVLPKIKKLIKKNIISEKDFESEKYFVPEIIP
jgi:putative peptide-modifying radical SAM enzyme